MPSDYVANLQKAIRAMHRCNSRYIESVPVTVTETVRGKIAWAGVVDVFDLIWHPAAKRAYAWSYRDGAQTKSVAVLETGPVDSPQSAVKITIAAIKQRCEACGRRDKRNGDFFLACNQFVMNVGPKLVESFRLGLARVTFRSFAFLKPVLPESLRGRRA